MQLPVSPAALDSLSDALASERKLIDELTSVILRQRAAIEVDDLHAVEDSVFTTHRLLLTLGEARKLRRLLNTLLGYNADIGLKQLGNVLGAQMTPRLQTEQDELQNAASRLSREVDINRQILRAALGNSEPLERVMSWSVCGSCPHPYMLILSRRVGETLVIDGDIKIVVAGGVARGSVRIGIEAPMDVPIWRGELTSPVVDDIGDKGSESEPPGI